MDRKTSGKILVALSIVYGVSVAALAYFDVTWMGGFAVVGALAMGALWALWGVFVRPRD
ncbi:hypothetical protein Afil01_60820 [Actinorhabdospora filicis]|uniref:Uncharacterized protein n=1 Tax=Actinorhabdospora filicis TaxID=1785913 RepID=A0A9W6WDW9_9ACTN|nr:hypothetical protein [Actinorhabdospora filicis]GLZ81275.1 hypothetical protein Afil01_60820 [Actinorhabdospora filicis]